MSQVTNVVFPSDQQEGTKSILSKWLKQIGDSVTADEPIAEVETDKVIIEIAAPASGILANFVKQEGEDVGPDDILATIESGAVASPEAPKSVVEPVQAASIATNESKAVVGANSALSPVVRKLIQQHSLNPDVIPGTGKKGRITKQDVENFLQNPSSSAPVATAPVAASPAKAMPAAAPNSSGIKGYDVPHNSMRKRIAEHMVDSLLNTAPHVTSIFEVDMSAVIAHRLANKADFKKRGVNLTFSAYFISACVEALQVVPEINSRFYEDRLEVFTDINIGMGTALGDKGLVVPVLHEAQNHNLFGLATKLQDMTEKARNGKLAPADMQNGTFTISNHGVSGSLVATPIIINQPQSAILGVGKLEKRVIVKEVDGQDTIAIRPMCYVSLSIDHRALDAYQTNLFLSKLVEVLEAWK